MKTVLNIFLVFLALSPLTSYSQNNPFANPPGAALIRSSVLPHEEAFSQRTFIFAPDSVVLLWDIEEGYYLYRKSLAITDNNGSSIALGEFPESISITDEFFGESQVYFDRLELRLPLSAFRTSDNTLAFTLQYQGCAQDRYCYPMLSKEVEIQLLE